MRLVTIRTLRLGIVTAFVELLVGLVLYALPGGFGANAYDQLGLHMGGFAMLCMAAGILLLLWIQGDVPQGLRPVVAVVAAVPLAVLSVTSATTGVISSSISYSVLAVGILAIALLRHPDAAPRIGLDLFAALYGAAQLATGLLMLLAPGLFAAPVYDPMRPYMPLIGVLALAGAAGMLLPGPRRGWADPRGAGPLVASMLFPLSMAWGFVQTGAWTGVISSLLYAAAFLLRRERFLRGGSLERGKAGSAGPQAFRTRVVAWSWVITLVVVLLMTIGETRSISSPDRVAIFTVGLGLCSVLTTWVLPNVLSNELIILVQLSALTLGVGVLFSGSLTGAEGLLALMAVLPAAAARALGRRPAFFILWLSGLTVAAGPLVRLALGEPDLGASIWRSALDLVVLLAANGLGLTTSIRQFQLVRELADNQWQLQYQNEALTAALDHAGAMQGLAGRLAAVINATPDYVMISDLEGHRLYVNEAARRLVSGDAEAPAEELSMEETYPEWARRRMLEESVPQALESGVWRGESALLDAHGREVPVLQVILAHKDEGGQVSYLSTVSSDITEFKQAEAALRESEERFRGAFDHASAGMALVDLEGRPFLTNQALREILGYTEAELKEIGFGALTYPDDLDADLALKAHVMAGKSHFYQMEKRYIHKDGRLVWAQTSVSLVRDDNGTPLYFVGQMQDITDRKQAETQMLHLATYDTLTDLFNRRRFQEELDRQLASAQRHGREGAVLFLDLDQFKYVNDSLGHAVGDELLKGVAMALKSRIRRSDVIARLGGDEFAVLLDEVSGDTAMNVARELLREVREHKQVVLGRDVNVTVSIGVALFPEHGITAGELLARADMAMYQAKELGRDACCLYSPTDSAPARLGEKLTWERRIRMALDEDRLLLYAQPIVDLNSGEIETHELLLRMMGEDGQIIPPGAFLGVAEQFGLIREIDRWVVERAIRFLAEAERAGRSIALSVNLSGKAFGDPELLPQVERLLHEEGVDPSHLMFELTETAAVGDPNLVISFVQALRRLGCRFALDDFGAGFSWFDYLKRLPVDVMKIDGSFVRHLDENNIDRHLVRAMVEAARGLGIRTVAECVESPEPVELLRSYGVEYMQGFHVGRPVPVEDLVVPQL